MRYCEMVQGEDGICRCTRKGCNQRARTQDCRRVVSACQSLPSLSLRARNFLRALIKHARMRLQRASQAEVTRRISICRECELYMPVSPTTGYCSHENCGCNLAENARRFLNKAAWKEQECPHPDGNKWGARL